MTKRKKIFMISSISIVVVAILIIGVSWLLNVIIPKIYSSAKKQCQRVLKKHQAQMEEVAVDALESGKDISGEYLDYYYSCDSDEEYVEFDIDAQGMLGGQYWGLVYTEDGTLWGETEEYLYEEALGNNIMRAERIDEHWWFLWTDYDGTGATYN